MFRLSRFNRRRPSSDFEIAPDEVLLDSSNLPNLDNQQFEGRLERPISRRAVFFGASVFLLIGGALVCQSWILQIKKGEAYSLLSERNSLRNEVVFAPRGVIYDRNGVLVASNTVNASHPDFPSREYKDIDGIGHLIGYVDYPKKDTSGFYYSTNFTGKDGVEALYDGYLKGINGTRIAETNALGAVESESVLEPPRYGGTLRLSVDSRIQSEMYKAMERLAAERGFSGGAGAIIDIKTGELVAVTSFPEYRSAVMSEGDNDEQIQKYFSDERMPFLDRAISGLYTPGSIVKPFLAVGALEEHVISPDKKILSTGSISVPNPYDPKKKSVFTDWRPQGWVDMRDAIAVSSDVYFYEVGGGFEDQIGLGIGKIEKYMKLFGFGPAEENNFLLAKSGVLPNPTWKEATFDGDPWRIGDTYNTAIGQYGVQVTLMQVVRATAAVANEGFLLEPTVVMGGNQGMQFVKNLGLLVDNIKVAKEGMRQAVLSGTASGLNIASVEIAAKTGTAELGTKKKYVNSWVEGFFPYENPRYAFAAVMEKGPHDNTVGALYVMRQLFDWMAVNTPEYLK